MAQHRKPDTKVRTCLFCGRSEDEEVEELIGKDGKNICTECLRKLVKISNSNEYTFTPAENLLGMMTVEILRIDKHQSFDFKGFFKNIRKFCAGKSNNLFDFISILSTFLNKARRAADTKEFEKTNTIQKLRESLEKLQRLQKAPGSLERQKKVVDELLCELPTQTEEGIED